MRIIGGLYKGRRISVNKKFSARPTTDFAKENLFNVLSNWCDFEDMEIMDLFAGTGGISYEFISRGAGSVIAVEQNFKHAALIKQNADLIGIKNLVIHREDVFRYITKRDQKFDIVFADPPYELKGVDKLPELIYPRLLKENGLFILEHSSMYNFQKFNGFRELRKYGSVHFSLFQ